MFNRGILFSLIFLVSCQMTPPIQEMSDARQAILAAQELGAGNKSTPDIKAAESYLKMAERGLKAGYYSQARNNAIKAKEKALQSLLTLEKIGKEH
jgi:hypothetical protein|tara:strand:+ start:286 stop:573 length:288 start_codon:yes stop_codon:yes gene_type:complete